MRRFVFTLAGLVAIATCPQRVRSQSPPTVQADETVAANAQSAAEFADGEAKRYHIVRQDEAEALKLFSEPVLRWSNPTGGGEVHGSVVLWLRHGCPEAAASIYRFFDMEQVNVELVSLSEAALTVERNGRVRWTPERDSVEFVNISGAPAPAETSEKRRLQMRALARQFSAELVTSPGDGRVTPLRLLARPLLDYEATDQSGREGSVFALVTANDPELLLLIETRPGEVGREWLHAAARMHFCALRLAHREQTVWEVPQIAPPWDKVRGPQGSYVILEWRTPEAAQMD